MIKKNFKYLVFYSFALYLIFGSVIQAKEKLPTVEDMLESSGLKIDYKKIDSGEIVIFPRTDQESTDRSIALSMGLYLNAPYKDVVQALRDGDNALSGYPYAIFMKVDDTKNIKPSFEKLAYVAQESDEIDKLYSFEEGDAYNLSDDEIKHLRDMVKKEKKSNKFAEDFFKLVLEKRMQAYLDKGVKGIADYNEAGNEIKVADGLKSSSIGLNSFKKWFPTFYKDYLSYPKMINNDYRETFSWSKDIMDDRPVFMLKHRMIKSKKNIAMVAERQYYISQGLDAIQMQMIVMSYKNGTFIGLSSQSFTNKVSGFARGIAVKVGRNMMTKQIKPMLDNLQKKFNK